MPLYIGDYLADTGHLDTVSHGAYLLMLIHYWRKGPLPDNNDQLCSICKLGYDAWSIVQALLDEFFTLETDGRYHQSRADHEISLWQGKKLKAQEKAATAAAARWGKDATSIPPSNAPSNPQAMLGSCPLPSPLPLPNKKRTISNGKPSDECLTLYKAYPRHVGPVFAYKAISKALSVKPFDYLLAAVNRFSKTQQGKDPEFIPHPATWFNAGRYDDESNAIYSIDAPKPKSQYEIDRDRQFDDIAAARKAAGR